MDSLETAKIESYDRSYWWFIARRELVLKLIARYASGFGLRLLDTGCGTGAFLLEAARLPGISCEGVDCSDEMVNICRKRGVGGVRKADACATGFAGSAFDVITALDVIEHIQSDESALAESSRILKKGGIFIISVPAYGFLWSGHDRALGHKRRYSRGFFIKRLEAAGFKIIRSTYCVSLLFSPIFMGRFLGKFFYFRRKQASDLKQLCPVLNNFFLSLMRFENRLILKGFNFPFGVSLVAVCKKE